MIRPGLFILALLALFTAVAPKPPQTTLHGESRSEIPEVDLNTASAEMLAVQWCGDQTTGDLPGEAADRPRIKVVYAYAADRPNRFAGWADALQSNVAIVQRYLAAQGGGTKVLRFDMGTRCGADYVDIQTVALPGARANYAENFRAVAAAVQSATANQGGLRNAIVLADGLANDVDHGLAETITGEAGERPGAANPHNNGGLTAILFTRDGVDPPGPGARGWWPEGFLHEITHTLGAVQWGAPHSTQPAGGQDPRYGHCWQGVDVMCYVEDGSRPVQIDCQPGGDVIAMTFDCGRDDYYNPAPPPGSYLATHWNTYDSVFMTGCQEQAQACGGGELWVPSPPAATSGPAIAGASRRGKALRAKAGTWINHPAEIAFQWQRQAGREWLTIKEATAAKYVPGTRDVGRRLRVLVTASNNDGKTAAASAPTAPVGAIGTKRTAQARSGDANAVDRREARRR